MTYSVRNNLKRALRQRAERKQPARLRVVTTGQLDLCPGENAV